MIVDRIDNWNLYSNSPTWMKAFDFLKQLAVSSEEVVHREDNRKVLFY